MLVLLLPVQFMTSSSIRFAPADVVLALALMFSGVYIATKRDDWSIWHFVLLALLSASLLDSAFRYGTITSWALLNKYVGLVALLLLYLLITQYARSLRDIWRVARLLLIAVALQGVVFLPLYFLGLFWAPVHVARIQALAVDPNAYAGMVAVALALHWSTLYTRNRLVPQRLAWPVTIVLLGNLLFSFSRSGWIAFGFIVVALLLFRPRVWRHILVPMALAAVVVGLFGRGYFATHILPLMLRPDQAAGRVTIITNAFHAFLVDPIFGGGVGSYLQTQDVQVHNSFFWMLADLGILGAIAFVGLMVVLTVRGYRAYRAADGEYRELVMGLFIAHLAMVGLSLGIEALYQRPWWVIMALLNATWVLNVRSKKRVEPVVAPAPRGRRPAWRAPRAARAGLVLHARDAFSTHTETGVETGDLATRSVRGGAVSFAGQGVQFVFNIGTTFVLARLLTPRDFGLVAMVAVIIAFGNLLRDAGLSSAVVQARTISREQASALFRVNVLVSLTLGVVLSAAGPAIAYFYHRPELTWITVGLALPLIIDGLATQHVALLRRNMKFTAVMLVQVGFQVSYFVGAVTTAFLGFGYWSLVFGNALGVIVAVTLAFTFCRWLPSRPPKGAKVGPLLRFGSHVLGSNVVTYFSGNTDNILVGRFLGAQPLGLYSRAFNFFALPMTQITEPIQRVGLPTLRHLVDDAERFRRYYLRIAGIVAALSFPLGMTCIVAGDLIVRLLLGPQWLGAVPVFRIFGAVMLINPVVATIGLVMLSSGRSRRYLHWAIVTAIVFVSSFVAGLHWGIVGVAAAYAVANYVLFLPAALYGLAGSPVKVRDLLGVLVIPLGATVGCGVIALAVSRAAGQGLLGQGLGVIAFVVVYCGLTLMRPSMRDLARRLQSPRGAAA